tara:strand:+ start:7992 stop:8360 length:369 start_codon:yes stop_codon:yes gene_type:complete
MILSWLSGSVIFLSIVALAFVIQGIRKDVEGAVMGGIVGMLLVGFIGWGVLMTAVNVKETSKSIGYAHKFVTDKNLIIELHNGRIKTFSDMKYLNKDIDVIEIHKTNSYNITSVHFYLKVKE